MRLADGVRGLLREAAGGEGLTPAQAQALLFAARTKTFLASVGNLAAALGTSHVNAVKVVAGLERRGLVAREPGDRDRRVSLLRLTPAGEQVVERLAVFEGALAAAAAAADGARGLEPALAAIVGALQEAGAVVVALPCRGCRWFVEDAEPGAVEPHRCLLVQRALSEREAALDCPDHAPAAAASR